MFVHYIINTGACMCTLSLLVKTYVMCYIYNVGAGALSVLMPVFAVSVHAHNADACICIPTLSMLCTCICTCRLSVLCICVYTLSVPCTSLWI